MHVVQSLLEGLDRRQSLCVNPCMATKTLSIDEEAYRILERARQNASESFSKVIKRAKWDTGRPRCGDLLASARGTMSDEALEALDRAQRLDSPPPDKWQD